jgi:hypothetical protein
MSSKTPAVPLEILAVVLTVTPAVLVCSRLHREDFRDEAVRPVDRLADHLFYGPQEQLVVVKCLSIRSRHYGWWPVLKLAVGKELLTDVANVSPLNEVTHVGNDDL